jgi:hypothetical protein
MHLLHFENDRYSLIEVHGGDVPRYGILSHTWGPDCDEVSFKDIREGTGKSKSGYEKIYFCAKQAAKDSLKYFWIDTCCIDKASSAELSEAINSMFRWYKEAVKCYVYLSDVTDNDDFLTSRWFTRGWTLQELVAPRLVEFYTSKGKKIGDKSSHMLQIESLTKIPQEILQGRSLSGLSVEERLSWVKTRKTKREEDLAYSLLGIFDVHMPLLYGEGRKKAFLRLEDEIFRTTSGGARFNNFRSPFADAQLSTEEFGCQLRDERADTETMANSMDTIVGGVYPMCNAKRFTRIGGRTGNIKVGGRAQDANTGISVKGHVSCHSHKSIYTRIHLPPVYLRALSKV